MLGTRYTARAADPLAPWQAVVKVHPLLPADAASHSVHAYFNTSPESPAGKQVVFFRSTAPDAQVGEVCVFDPESKEVRVLAKDVEVEDVHRTACQQWIAGGQGIVFHALRDSHWTVIYVDLASGKERVLATDRQVAWGSPTGEVVPLYGPHWQPGEHRNLELANVRTGEIKTVLKIEDVRQQSAEWFAEKFGEKPVSIFFPILSPNGERVLFKIATPTGGDFRSPQASQRDGLFCYDLTTGKLLAREAAWGHPAWHPDSRRLINVRRRQLIELDTTTGVTRDLADSPTVPGSHPSYSPDGKLFVTDLRIEAADATPGMWGVMVGEVATGKSVLLHQFIGNRGASSWRPSHPHPVFSPDGRRIYFNVNADRWTRLYVAEAGAVLSSVGQ